ncbi:uncharacterized protein LOC122251529 [Penaeus japonicus]|uniref:uncharacterized protein LOC122251529 n=1 Tax=Penaeus japonicus TaxID=27405 RepID=UPI001C710559|nr:uncharacterized protein LOC122251529 [Penaeus japonicus]
MYKDPWPLRSPSGVLLALSLLALLGGPSEARSDDRLLASLEELTAVLRDLGGEVTTGINKLLNELQQERLRKGGEVQTLKEQVTDNRRALDVLRSEMIALASGRCPAAGHGAVGEGSSGDVRGLGAGMGGNERARSSSAGGRGNDEGDASADDTPPDGDCPSPYKRFGKYCLTLLKERNKWEFARSRCHLHARSMSSGRASVKGDLVVPHDMEAFKAFITSTDFGGAPTGRAWVGGSAEGWGGVWAWVDGSLMNELPWVYSQASGEGSRIAVDHESIFHTVGDGEILWSVCQYLPS